MVFVQNCHFSNLFFFLPNIGQENVFYVILERINAFLGSKNKKFKNSKNWHFSIGVNPWFWPKNGHFSIFCFFGDISQENVFYDILEQKTIFLGYKNKKFKKSKNWHFSKGVNPRFWSKNGNFSNIFVFFGNIGQENVFFDILEWKAALLGNKKKKFKKVEKLIVFVQKCHFSNFFGGGNIGQENLFYNILEQINAFLGYKNNKFKKAKK